jgi:hypothetical protein
LLGRVVLHAEEIANEREGVVGVFRRGGGARLEDLASEMRPTSGPRTPVRVGDVIVPRVPIHHEGSARAAEDLGGGLAAPIDGENVEDELPLARFIVAVEDPYEAALAAVLETHRGLVREHDVECRDALLEASDERTSDLGGGVNEVIHRAARDRDPQSTETLLDAVDRDRVGALLDDQERDEPEAVLSSGHELGRTGCGHDVLAADARLFLALVDTPHEVPRHILERRARLVIERTKVRSATLGAALHRIGHRVLDLLGRHRGIPGEGPLAPLCGDGFAASGELFLGHLFRIVTQLAVDGRDLDPLGLGSEELSLQPLDLGLKALGARRLLGILRGQPALEVDDEDLLRRDQRLLLRDDLAKLTLALSAGTQLPLKLRDTKVSRVRHALCLCTIACPMESTSWTRADE